MSGRITSSPEARHHCNAGWRIETDAEAAAREALPGNGFGVPLPVGSRLMIEERPWAAEGTIWTCDDCGKRWKATYPYVNVFSPTWVKISPPRVWRWPWRRK
jgi:hypothetical protein